MTVKSSAFMFRAALASAAVVTVGMMPNAVAEKYASIVVDLETDEVLHARHADAPRYPASLTKAMTLYMLFDAMKSGEVKLYENLPVFPCCCKTTAIFASSSRRQHDHDKGCDQCADHQIRQ